MASPSEDDGSETNEVDNDTSEYSPFSEAASSQDSEQLQSLSTLANEASKQGTKRKHRAKDDKICGVCGDKALGYNFDAISCESCKAFFRRNALKNKISKCMFSGTCKLDINTRRFCSFCRLSKCLEIGMKKDMILGDTQKKARLEKMSKNKQRRGVSTGEKITPVMSPQSDDSSNYTTVKVEPSDSLPEDHEYFCWSPSEPTTGLQPMRKMSAEEILVITELSTAYQNSFYKMEENPTENSKLNDLVNYSGLIVRKLIKFAKKIDDFVRLSQDSQIWLLKGVVLSTLFIRSAEHYNQEKDAWITPTCEIPTIVLKRATGYEKFHEEHIKYCKSIKPLTQDDPNILMMMMIISLFYPDRPNVTERETVSDAQDKYICLLKHYLESKYSFYRARQLFPRILAKLDELQELTENHGRVLLHVNPSEIEPLMLEIFDLK
ncbi:nuclear hormone receptor HR96-like isoform X2 [Lineus longissimus]